MDRKRVFIHSEDPELALKLVKLLDRHGVTALWVTQEQGETRCAISPELALLQAMSEV